MSRYRAVAVALLVLASLAAGCGDDDDDGGDALTEAAFLEQGNAICTEGGDKLDEAANEAFTEEPDAAAMKAFIDDVVVPGIREQVDAIDELVAPEDLRDDVDELIDAANARLDELAAMDDDEVMELFTTGDDPFAEVNALSSELGLTACAEG